MQLFGDLPVALVSPENFHIFMMPYHRFHCKPRAYSGNKLGSGDQWILLSGEMLAIVCLDQVVKFYMLHLLNRLGLYGTHYSELLSLI